MDDLAAPLADGWSQGGSRALRVRDMRVHCKSQRLEQLEDETKDEASLWSDCDQSVAYGGLTMKRHRKECTGVKFGD